MSTFALSDLAGPVLGVVAQTSGEFTGASGVTSITWTQTVATGSNLWLYVAVTSNATTTGVTTGVTYAGVAMTKIADIIDTTTIPSHRTLSVWGLKTPTVGTASVVATFSASVGASAVSIPFANVNQLAPYRTVVTNTGGSSGAQALSTTTTGGSTSDLNVSALGWRDNTGEATPGTNQTLINTGLAGSGSGFEVTQVSTQPGGSSIADSWTWTDPTDACCEISFAVEYSGVVSTQNQLGKSRIKITTLRTQLAKSRIGLKTVKTQIAKAHINAGTTRTQLGKANLRATTLRLQTAVARIRITTVHTILGKSRISLLTIRTQPGKSRISLVTMRTQLGKSRITHGTPRTQTGKSRITIVTTRTQTGKDRSGFLGLNTQTAKSRIKVTTLRTQIGKSRIKATTVRTQLAKGRIGLVTTKTQLGKATIPYLVTHPGKANIKANTKRLQLGVANIEKFAPFDPVNPFANVYTPTLTSVEGDSLTMRVWGNVGDSGRDVLGNFYRYAAVKDAAANALDPTSAGWMSAPQPSPTAVVSLYFDIRQQVANTLGAVSLNSGTISAFGLVDAIAISPRTPGVTMNIYFTQANLNGTAPTTADQWDNLVWTPLNDSFTLRQDTTIELPSPIVAAFIKLEFTNLRPLTFNVPTTPVLPPQNYNEYPTWVEQQYSNTQVVQAVSQWFSLNATPIQQLVLQQITDPVAEFQYEQREFMAALSLGAASATSVVNNTLLSPSGQASMVDPVTASQIYIQPTNAYQNTLLLSVDQSSILGQMVSNRYNSSLQNDTLEAAPPTVTTSGTQLVSSTSNLVTDSYSNLAQTPMKFNQRSRHTYKVSSGQFNNKAYFAGVADVAFLRSLTTQAHDDTVITDVLYDDMFFTTDTWERESGTSIADGTIVYLSYEIGTTTYTDEMILLSGGSPVQLQGQGGQAINAMMFAGPGSTGVQYFADWDYALSFTFDANGTLTNYVAQSELVPRLTAPKLSIAYSDVGVVTARSYVPAAPKIDAAVVTSIAKPITTSEGRVWTDNATITGIGIPSGTDRLSNVSSGVVTSVALPTFTDNFFGHGLFGQGLFGGVGGTFGTLASSIIPSNTTLVAQQYISSDNGTFTLIMQGDGNFVEYVGTNFSPPFSIWSTGTQMNNGAYITMRSDGNLIVYSSSGVTLWSSGTAGNPGAYLLLEDNGEIKIQLPSGTILWSIGIHDVATVTGVGVPSATGNYFNNAGNTNSGTP